MKVSTKKRFLAWVMTLLMVVTYMPSIAYATDNVNVTPNGEAVAEESAAEVTAVEENETVVPATAGSASVEPLAGKVSVSNTLSTAVLENGIVTLTAKAPATALGTPETNNVTIYNETADEAVLKFDYAASNCKEFSLGNDSGTYKKVLAAGESMTLHFTAGAYGSENASLTLSNFSLEVIADSYDITVSYDDKLGSVTAGGAAIASGDTKTVSYADGLALAAASADGAEFLGWINADTYELYSKEASYTINPTADEKIKAVFINETSDAFFLVSGKYLVEGFDAAAAKAASTSGKKMVLMNDATLKEGNYAVPAGVTMLIPFDDENTLYTDAPEATNEKYVTPTAYRTLKMADGAVLTVNGTLSLSAVHYAANSGLRGSGAPTGEVSFLDMEKGSSLVVNDGAYLYAYGFVVGEGTVTAKSGATVYENFQINDFRGGSATSAMAVDDTLAVEGSDKGINHGVLPISQYYVQNIEVPMTLEAGAAEYTYTSIFMNSDIYGAAVAFISDRYAMFNLSSGTVMKAYDGATDRLIVEANGDMSLSPITIKLKGVEEDIDSSNFELPINSNITVKINSGEVEIDQDIALLPGSEIVIAKGAKCTLANGTNVYVYDADQWGNFVYNGSSGTTMRPVVYAYSKPEGYDRSSLPLEDASVLVNGTLDASAGYLYTTSNSNWDTGYGNIYSTENGVIKMLSGEEYVTYQATQSGTDITYNEISILPANLKQNSKDNAEYLQALDDVGIAGTYTYTDGVWLCDHECTEDVTKEADCTNTGAKTVKCVMDHEYNLTVPAKGHTAVTDPAVKGSCTVDAKTEGSHCSVCDEVLVAQEVTKAPGHTEVVDKGYAATCLEDGLTDGKHCSVCEEVIVKQEVIPSLGGHKWKYDENAKPATCTEEGYGSSVCENCGEEIKGDTIPALGHDYKWTVTTDPTCTKEGVKEGVCQRDGCGHETTGTVEATGHNFKNYVDNKDATCTEEGTATAECENGCGETKDKATEALGHIWKKDGAGQLLYEVVIAPTCTAKGEEAIHCERCDATKDPKEIDATGHTEETLKAVAPTCTDAGKTAGVKCSVCDEIIKAQEEVPSLGGHKWDEGVIAKLPTVEIDQATNEVTNIDGKRIFECQNTGCKEYKEEVLKWGSINTYDEFIKNIEILEDWAFEYAIKNNIEDPAALVIRYIRTGVDRYNSGSWQIMAGFDNTKFTDYVSEKEILVNDKAKTEADKVNVTGLKNISNFTLANGDYVDFGHMFGTIDISYTNKTSINHADVAGFFGDTTDLLTTADRFGVTGTIEEMVKDINDNYFLKDTNWDDKFGNTDMLGDLDGYYINRELISKDYEKGMFTDIMSAYFTKDLTEKQRAEYYLTNRLQCGTSKAAVRDAVYMAYTGNSVIATLEGTRTFNTSGDKLSDLRKAACYVVADYICRLAGDYVEYVENDQFTVQSEQFATLAPGITQEIKTAKKDYVDEEGNAAQYDMKYYIATADITRDDVEVWVNYPTRPIEKDADGNYVWDRKRVLDQANTAQKTYGDPDSDLYIENFQVVASTNADGYDMTGNNRGEPGGLLVMDGEEIYPIKANGFFGITKEGKAIIGSSEEYNNIYRGKMKEAVGGFGTRLVEDGKIATTAAGSFHSRTAVGITGSGKVVMMVLDGRQELSVGGDMLDLAHIMLNAGCVDAINLDGGGSSTYVARQPGDDELTCINHPSDGYMRDVASSLMAISTAKSSTVFDKAVLKAPTNYMTVGSELQMTAEGITSTGNAVDVPEGVKWVLNEEDVKDATISADGKLTALRTGTVTINLMLDGVSVGSKQIHIVIPDTITFTKPSVDVVYESSVTLPIKAYYEGKAVTINANDFEFVIKSEKNPGKMEGLDFVAGPESTGVKRVEVAANVKDREDINATITVALYKQGENTFDFDKKTGGDREFAWQRVVSNSVTGDNTTYYAVDKNKDMETSYVFAIDMTAIPMPEVLEELTVMLPGHDIPGACAWTYLCDLAQRISDITEVTATVKIDDRFELVEPEKITVKNEYFKLPEDGSGIVYDKTTNTVTLKLNWVRQYSPIDREMANPLCLVNGIKLVPKKDANWGVNETINAINEGSVSYKVYMRASSLYTFSKDPENQKKYGLKEFSYTYIDKNGIEQVENGGGFEATYKTFKDSYNLVKADKNGWIAEDGGWRYYKDGEALKGVQLISEIVDGKPQSYYYDFGEEGIIKGSKKETYTGFVKNADGTYSYSSIGTLIGGWIQIGEDWYYFKPDTKKSWKGKHDMTITALNKNDLDPTSGREYEKITNTVPYEFNEKGKLLNGGVWFTDKNDKTYFYFGPGFKCSEWGEKNGKTVYFTRYGYLQGGIYSIKTSSSEPIMYYMFDRETYEFIKKCEGFVKDGNYTYYYAPQADRASGKYTDDMLKNGKLTGLQQIDGKYYYLSEKYGAMQYGKKDIPTDVEGKYIVLNFSKAKGGYAVNAKGKAITSLEHSSKHSMSVVSTVKATTAKDGYRLKRCKTCGWEEKETIYKIDSIKLSKTTYVYNGYSQKPKVTVKDANGKNISSKYYYTVKYSTGRKAVGRYKATVTFKTRYSGTKTLYFTIVPKAPASAKAVLYGHDDVKFSWSKSKGATGYTVYYKKATADSYTRLGRTTGTSMKAKNLTDGIKYTFKVVPYYKTGGVRYGSAYKTASVYTLKKMDAPVITNSSDTSVNVEWADISGQTGYQISKSAFKSGTNIVSTFAITTDGIKTLKTTKGKTYYYKIRAYKKVGKTKIYGPWSEVVKYKLQPEDAVQ